VCDVCRTDFLPFVDVIFSIEETHLGQTEVGQLQVAVCSDQQVVRLSREAKRTPTKVSRLEVRPERGG
jgi:hypothetical protein